MRASIFSCDELKKLYGDGTRGKTSTVNPSEFDVQAKDGMLTITAHEKEFYCPGDIMFSITPAREIQRELTLQFTAEDLKRILDAALAAHLIHVSFSVSRSPV